MILLRFAAISLSTLLVLGAVFFALVWHAQPPGNAQAALKPIEPTKVSPTQNASGVGPGYKPWSNSFENGVLTSRFTAIEFTPQKDGSFLVDHPISVFYLDKGQRAVVTGDRGQVNCDSSGPGSTSSNGLTMGPTSTPRNGSLKHVRVELFSSPTATVPTQWMETDNIHFDNDTLRMYTESYVDDHGNTIAADQVPVKVRGEQYEFDGDGMTVKWDANRRLQLLQIDHGKRLEIINPSKLALLGMSPAEPAKPAEPAPANVMAGALASSDPSAVSLLLADAKPIPAPAKIADVPFPYLAVFHDQVKIADEVRTLAVADLMKVNFLQGSGKDQLPTPKTNPPADAPATEPAAVNADQPISLPANPSTRPAVKSPTTKPVNGPVTIYWTGPLLVTPLKGEPLMPLAPGQSIVQLLGSPVRLTPQGSEVIAASATYRNPDGAVRLEKSDAVPVIQLTQTKGLKLATQSIDYDPGTAIALIGGPSELQMPVGQKPMDVTWSRQGKLHIIRVPSQPNGVDHVDLTGDVEVRHPLFALNSRDLQLDMDLLPRPGGKPTDADEQVKTLTAIHDVTCQLKHSGKSTQEIDGDKLVFHTEQTADKKTLPREVVADGHVHAFDLDQSLTASHLVALLVAKTGAAPVTQPSQDDVGGSVDLDSLYASSNVHALMKNGATADADELRIATVDGKQQVELTGAAGAKVSNGKGSWLAGPIVHLYPDRSGVSVEGPGMLETIRAASTTQPVSSTPPKPIDVTWTDSMWLDGTANVGNVFGHVMVKNTDAIGTVSTITGDTAPLDLVDIAKNTQKSGTVPPDATGGKQLKKLTLTDHVVGLSELDDSSGSPLRRENLYGNQLIYTAADGTALIPGAGKLFVENHKPDTKDGATSRGAMAIQWDKQLTYDQNTQVINIEGDTRVGFEQEPKAGKPAKPQAPMQLDSDRLIITLSKVSAPATSSTNTGQGKMQLSRMQSIGSVRFIAKGVDLSCSTMDYDPKTSIMTLNGTPDQPGRAMNAAQDVTGTFQQLHYNTATEEIIDAAGMQGTIRR